MEKRVRVSDVILDFDRLVDAARELGESIVVERDGVVLCRIVPEKKSYTAGDFAEWLKNAPAIDEDFARDVRDARDWSDLCPKCYRSRFDPERA